MAGKKFAARVCAGFMLVSAYPMRANWGHYHSPRAFSKFGSDLTSVAGIVLAMEGAPTAIGGAVATCGCTAVAVFEAVADDRDVAAFMGVAAVVSLCVTLIGALQFRGGVYLYNLGREWRDDLDADDEEYQELSQEFLAEIEEVD